MKSNDSNRKYLHYGIIVALVSCEENINSNRVKLVANTLESDVQIVFKGKLIYNWYVKIALTSALHKHILH
jgi:hypothetical protein